MTSFRAAAIQMRSGRRTGENAAAFEKSVREAAGLGARYVQSPEMTGALVRGAQDRAAAFHRQADDPVVAVARRLSRELSLYLHVGSTAILLPGGKVANRAFLFGPDGGLIATYDKIHMFDVDLDGGESWRESAVYAPGEKAVVARLPFASLGLAICYDLRFPQLFRAEAQAGADVLSVPAAFTRQTGEAHWHTLIRARAIENGAFVVAAAQGGRHEDGRETYGHSLIVDPWGKVLAEAGHDEPGVIVADIDPAQSTAARAKIPNLANARAFSVEKAASATPFLEDAAS